MTPQELFAQRAEEFRRAAFALLDAWNAEGVDSSGAPVFDPETIETWLPIEFGEWCYNLAANMEVNK